MNDATAEVVHHGLDRRLSSLRHCIDRVYEVLPPATEDPDRDCLSDVTAFLQAFIINVFGAVDNLARIWCLEDRIVGANGRPLRPIEIGLTPRHAVVRASLPQAFQDYLVGCDPWFSYLENYRHALAHRVPLYIPPRSLNEEAQAEFRRLEHEIAAAMAQGEHDRYFALRDEQRRVGTFRPWMMHSYGEGARPVYIHPQMICDFSTVVEFGEHMIQALGGLAPAP